MKLIQEHNQKVKDFFDNTEIYLRNSFGIQIRIDIVKEFVKNTYYSSILDIGCGDGSISVALLKNSDQFTLLDISPKMLNKAKMKIPHDHKSVFRFIEGDYSQLNAESNQYKLVLAIGVLAHIDAVDNFLNLLERVTMPGGFLILQFTEHHHWLSKLKRNISKFNYKINAIHKSDILKALSANKFELIDSRQFGLILPGFGKLPNSFLYHYERFVLRNKFVSSFGTDYMLYLKKNENGTCNY